MRTIWILGATGKGGRAIASELIGASADVVLVGRDYDRLAATAASLGGKSRTLVASGPAELATLIAGEKPAVVVNTIGPFGETSAPLARACLLAGSHYVDLANELPPVQEVLDMDANYYLQTIKVVFQDFSLVNGTWDIRNPQGQLERVRPQDIKTTALFSVEGELDDISGSGQTEAVHAICSGVVDSEQRHLIVEGAGHYGIFSGRRWREVVYPEVKKFILAHQPSPAPTATQSSESSPSITPTRPAATKKAAKKPAAAKPTAAAKPVGTVAEASLAAPTPTRSKAVTNKKAVPAKRTPATASGKSAPRTARRK